MTVKLNSKGKTKANSLVSSGNVDKTSDWSFSAEDGNKILGDPPDWDAYGEWFLGTDDEYDKETKQHWKYPFGKNGKVYRSGLIAIRQRAAQQNETEIFDAAGALIEKIDGDQEDKSRKHYNRSPFNRYRNNNIKIFSKNTELEENEATLYIYDEISWFGIEANDFVRELNAQTAETINIRINSPGGSFFDGVTIYNAIKQHKSNVIIHVDGLAGSIASVIAMGGKELHMAKSSYLMIHEPWSIAIGTAADMKSEADLLENISGTIAEIYADKSGINIEKIKEMMDQETWLKGKEAVEMGLADKISASDAEKEEAQANLFDLSIFANTPKELKNSNAIEPTAREIERILRNAGCSAKKAKTILSKGLDGFRDESLSDKYLRDEDKRNKNLRDEDSNLQPQRDVGNKSNTRKKYDRTDRMLLRVKYALQ